ncbi:hypothetical protein PoB_002632800 [Plakobranchus ocellatus]|uniref:Uncharacterized protein n=1 Tax=Plakobranchus ocellatus TaxID=259542 RepID=A0AAV3ZZF8_9GAST|nr:hypothetical protein PoB_002632800 [Plakobranchus ocellatus]
MGFETGNVDKEFWTTRMNDKRRAEEDKAKGKKEAQERNGTVVVCVIYKVYFWFLQSTPQALKRNWPSTLSLCATWSQKMLYAMYGRRQTVDSPPTSLQAAILITCHLYQALTKSFCIAMVAFIKTKVLYWPVHYLRFPYSENVKFNRNTL